MAFWWERSFLLLYEHEGGWILRGRHVSVFFWWLCCGSLGILRGRYSLKANLLLFFTCYSHLAG